MNDVVDFVTTKMMYENGWGKHDGFPIEWDADDPTSQYSLIRENVESAIMWYEIFEDVQPL